MRSPRRIWPWFTLLFAGCILAAACRSGGPEPESAAKSGESPPEATQNAANPSADGVDGSAEDAEDDALIAELEAEAEREGLELKLTPACFDLVGEDHCTGVGVVQLVCGGLGNLLDAPSHGRLLSCLKEKNDTKEICETKVLRTCGLAAIAVTTVDPAVATFCDSVFDRCKPSQEFADVWKPDLCRAGLSSLIEQPRKDFVECMLGRCDLRLCLGGML